MPECSERFHWGLGIPEQIQLGELSEKLPPHPYSECILAVCLPLALRKMSFVSFMQMRAL